MIQYAPEESLDLEARSSRSHDPLTQILTQKVQCLVDILASIESEAAGRHLLSTLVLDEISKNYRYLKTKLYELDTWGLGINRNIEARRSKLEAELDKLNQETREERVRMWQDIAVLKKEQRTWLKQYSDLLQRVQLVLKGSRFLSQSRR